MGMICRSPQTDEEWEEYYALRYAVLRKPLRQSVGSERTPEDASGMHFALFQAEKIIAIARLDKVDADTVQARFVAVHPQFQKQGFGKLIMQYCEQSAKKLGHQKIILHARENSLTFYKRLGYRLLQKSHLLFGKVQHYLMEKMLE